MSRTIVQTLQGLQTLMACQTMPLKAPALTHTWVRFSGSTTQGRDVARRIHHVAGSHKTRNAVIAKRRNEPTRPIRRLPKSRPPRPSGVSEASMLPLPRELPNRRCPRCRDANSPRPCLYCFRRHQKATEFTVRGVRFGHQSPWESLAFDALRPGAEVKLRGQGPVILARAKSPSLRIAPTQ